jgi:hypothetical protein
MTTRYADAIFLYPSIWKSIHVCALTLPLTNNAKRSYKDFLNSLIVLMPDISARYSLSLFMKRYEVSDYMDTNEDLFYWTYDLHKFVNQIRKYENVVDPSLIDFPSFADITKVYGPDKLNKLFWSTAMWRTIHGLASVYPIKPTYKQKLAYTRFMKSLVYILPCPKCRVHLGENLKTLNVNKYTGGTIKLFYFTYLLHKMVNEHVGDDNITWKQALVMYKLV